MKSTPLLLAVLVSIGIIGCTSKETKVSEFTSDSTAVPLKYAEGFRVTKLGNCKVVEVLYPFQGATSGYTYLLVPRDEEVPSHDASTRVIRTPLQSIVCTSTTHIPLLDYLGETDKLVGFPSTNYISSKKMRERVDANLVQDLGIDKGLNLEKLAMLQPDLVMGYTMSSDYGTFKKVEDLNIPVVLNAEYLEKHPLGRAEWIKYVALFFDKESLADSIFNSIEHEYLETKTLASTAKEKPTVFSGIVYGDAWFLPGGQNYAGKILKDAGCKYLWEDDPSNGFLELSFESVYERAKDADFWIGVAAYRNLDDLENNDHRYAKFKAFQQKMVYTYDAKKGAKGGSEYLELGYLRPDIILKDLVKITHPELLPDYTLYFHAQLQ